MSLILGMAGLGFNFDANQVAPDAGQMGPIPAGWYVGVIEHSEIKPTQDGSGAYISVRVNVLAPQEYVNRKVFHNFNIKNNSQQAVDIAMGQLSALAHAVNVLNFQDTQQLHAIPFKFRVKIRKGEGNYSDQNNVTAWKPQTENVTLGPEGGAAQTSAAPSHPGMGAPVGAPQVQQPQASQTAPQQAWNQQPSAPQQPQYAPQAQPQQAPAQQAAPAQPWEQAAPAQQAPAQQPAPQTYPDPNAGQAAPQQYAPQPAAQQAPASQPAPAGGAAVPPWVNQQ